MSDDIYEQIKSQVIGRMISEFGTEIGLTACTLANTNGYPAQAIVPALCVAVGELMPVSIVPLYSTMTPEEVEAREKVTEAATVAVAILLQSALEKMEDLLLTGKRFDLGDLSKYSAESEKHIIECMGICANYGRAYNLKNGEAAGNA